LEDREKKLKLLKGARLNIIQDMYHLALYSKKSGDFATAEKWYLKTSKTGGDFAGKAFNDLGNLYLSRGDHQAALDNYREAISLGVDIAIFNYGYVSEIYFLEYEIARKCYERAGDAGIDKATARIKILEEKSRKDHIDRNLQDAREAEANEDIYGAVEAYEAAESWGSEYAASRLKVLRGIPKPLNHMSPREAEFQMAKWLVYWGFLDAKAGKGSNDEGIDVEGDLIVAQVKHRDVASTREELQKLHSNMVEHKKRGVFFSRSGFTRQATEFAIRPAIQIALFTFDNFGVPTAVNELAKEMSKK
jgi:tetratricopeptide (TPR) repeat protein